MISLDDFLKFKLLHAINIDIIYQVDFVIYDYNSRLYLEIFTFIDNNGKTENILISFSENDFVNFIIGNLTYLEMVELSSSRYKVTRLYSDHAILAITPLLDDDLLYTIIPTCKFDSLMYIESDVVDLDNSFPDLKTLRLFS